MADPQQPFVYASDPADNAIQVINTQTLTVAHKIDLGATPKGIGLSPDGQSLYVTEPSNNQIAVINTQSFQIGRTIATPPGPSEVAIGLGNRLFVQDVGSAYSRIQQIDATTGAQAGPDFPSNLFYYYGNFQISADLKTLYFGQHGLSPTTLYSFDVSSTNVQLKGSVVTGENGKDAVLSHNGNWIAQPNGAPYEVSLLSAKDFSLLGTFQTGSYPGDMAFSPDDKFAYTSQYASSIVKQFSTSTFQNMGQFSVPDEITSLVTETSGQHLFASLSGIFSNQPSTVVYDTGYSVPEPSSTWLLGLCLLALLMRRRIGTRERALA